MAEGEPKFEQEKSLEDQINSPENVELLKKQNWISIETNLTNKEKESIEQVNIERQLQPFDYYGPASDELMEKLEDYFKKIGDNSKIVTENISQVINRVSNGVARGFNKESMWVSVRIALPNDEFDVPRWHPDGNYFKSADKVYKLVMTVKGPSTLFAEKIDPEKFEKLMGSSQLEEDDDQIKKIRQKVDLCVNKIDIPQEEKAVIYLVGHKDAVVHSEPDIKEPRIFVSVLPGSKQQISEWNNRLKGL